MPPSRKAQLILVSDKPEAFRAGEMYICKLAYADRITLADEAPADAEKMVSVVTNDAKIFMPLAELVDLDAERARLTKEIDKAKKQVEGQERKLANENFVSRAPEQVVAVERDRLEKAKALLQNLEESLKNLG